MRHITQFIAWYGLMRLMAIALVLGFTTVGCVGPKGDKGDQGLQGIQGEPGPAGMISKSLLYEVNCINDNLGTVASGDVIFTSPSRCSCDDNEDIVISTSCGSSTKILHLFSNSTFNATDTNQKMSLQCTWEASAAGNISNSTAAARVTCLDADGDHTP